MTTPATPRTAAGRAYHDRIANAGSHNYEPCPLTLTILAIEAEAVERYSGMVAVLTGADEQGLLVHVATRATCAEHIAAGDDSTVPATFTEHAVQPCPD